MHKPERDVGIFTVKLVHSKIAHAHHLNSIVCTHYLATWRNNTYHFVNIISKRQYKIVDKFLSFYHNSRIWRTPGYWLMAYRRCIHLQCKAVKREAQLSQRDRAAGWVIFGQKWNTISYRSFFYHCDGIGLQSYGIRWNNAK